jgi:hypothetical protein
MPRHAPVHRADAVRPRWFSVAGFAKTSAALVVAIFLALFAANGTYAYLTSRPPLAVVPSSGATTATLSAGTASLTVSTPAAFAALYPGSISRQSVVVTNNGNITLSLTVGTLAGPSTPTPFSENMTVTVFPVSAGNPCSGTAAAPAGSWGGTFASSSTASIATSVAAGNTATLCISLSLLSTAPVLAASSASAPFSLVIGGDQQ